MHVWGNLIQCVTVSFLFSRYQNQILNLKNKVIVACKPEFANGIISHDHTVIWHLEGQPNFISGSYDTVTAVEIDENEYKTIREVLDGGAESVEDEEIREPLTNTAVMELLASLQTQVQELTAKNERLESELAELNA